MTFSACALACSMLIGLCCAHVFAQDRARWRTIHREQGVTVSTHDEPGSGYVSFRGQGTIDGALLHVLAVVLDDERSREWAKNADAAKVLRTIDQYHHVVYSRSNQTWPVRDRDLVMRRTVEVLQPAEAFRVRLVCVAGEYPELPSVVRINRCETEIVLRRVDQATTSVDYRVRVDPGGGNPEWLVRMASKNIPLETVVALRKQVAKTQGQYESVMRKWADSSS